MLASTHFHTPTPLVKGSVLIGPSLNCNWRDIGQIQTESRAWGWKKSDTQLAWGRWGIRDRGMAGLLPLYP